MPVLQQRPIPTPTSLINTRAIVTVCVAALFLLGAAACPNSPTGTSNDNVDAGPAAVLPQPTRVTLTGGGGASQSPRYKVRVTVGAPQPSGPTGGPNHAARTGSNVVGPASLPGMGGN